MTSDDREVAPGISARDIEFALSTAEKQIRLLIRDHPGRFPTCTGWESIIKHGIYHRNNKPGVNESVMWGDYYFVEALHRMTQGSENNESAGYRNLLR